MQAEILPDAPMGFDRLADLQAKMAENLVREGRQADAKAKQAEAAANWQRAIDLGIFEYDPMIFLGVLQLKRGAYARAECGVWCSTCVPVRAACSTRRSR